MYLYDKIEKLLNEQNLITSARKSELQDLAKLILLHLAEQEDCRLAYICTHNSRRSQLSELWMFAGIRFFKIERLEVVSAGTEATAFNPRMVAALRRYGFDLMSNYKATNPTYELRLSYTAMPDHEFYSKTYEHPSLAEEKYVAIMVCDHAHETCPVIPSASDRFPLLYVDPKVSDDTPQESDTYDAKVKEIGREMMYLCECLALSK